MESSRSNCRLAGVGIENAAVYTNIPFFSGPGSGLFKDRDVVLMEKRKPVIAIELLQ